MFVRTGYVTFVLSPDGGGATGALGGGNEDGSGGNGNGDSPAAPWAGAEGVWNIGEGDSAKPWWSAIAEPDVRAHVESKQFASPAELAMANLNLTRMQRGAENVVNVPGKDASDDEWSAFYTKLGRPETSDAYDFKFPDGAKVDDGLVAFGKSLAFDLGLSPERAQKMVDAWQKHVTAANQETAAANTRSQDEAVAAVRAQYTDDAAYDAAIAAGRRVVAGAKISDETLNALEGQIGTAAVLEVFTKLGAALGEDGFRGNADGGDPNDPNAMSAEQAAARIEQLQSDQSWMAEYMNGDKSKVAYLNALFAKAGSHARVG